MSGEQVAEEQDSGSKRATTQISIRVHSDTLAHFKKVAAGKNVPWTQELRQVLSQGFECRLGRCAHATKLARKLAHLDAYERKYGVLAVPKGFERPPGESARIAGTSVSEFTPTEEEVVAAGVDTESGEFF